MPRRRPSSKAKSRSKPRPVDRKESRLKRWDKPSEIELDEEDQFHASRDKILLDVGNEYGDDDEDEDEVFALQGMSDDEDEAEDEDAVGYHDEEGEDIEEDASNKKSTSRSKPKSSKSKSDSKKSKDTSPQPDSEEEETWGRSKGAYYSSNAAQLDSDDEEANELEEQEALRLQAKARDALRDDDFGLGDVMQGEVEPADASEEEEAPKLISKEVPQDKQSILRFLEKESPETLALARDWDDTARNLVEAKARVDAIKVSETDGTELGLQHMYYQALLTYATTLAFYLHLRVSGKYASRPDLLRRHPILNRLLKLKQALSTLESIGVGQDVSEDEEEDELSEFGDENGDGEPGDLWSLIKKKSLESSELAELLEDEAAHSSLAPSPMQSNAKEPPKKKRKTSASLDSTKTTPGVPVFDLVEPTYAPTTSSSKKRKSHASAPADTLAAADSYGEAISLDHADLSDKHARKKSLRFHVSRIESSSSRRTNARANAMGGDDDIPYRERRKEREVRLGKEKEKKIEKGLLGTGGDDLDDVDPDVVSRERKKEKRKRELDDDADGDEPNGYYALVKQAATSKKAQKKAEYEAATARPDLDHEDASGPRSITRAILKNKGLTPHRSKAVRNPRVKKRQKYEQAKKKVASQRSVYKGGIGDVSKYSGEQSGISKVVKSVRLE
ncbi:Sas10 C-terminal domain-containing protein [Melanogaster broomeanus]|nr:Sas10 C-terminal domain-containing protein [Melanogaster broomeanus]